MASMLDSIFSARIFKGGVEYMQRKTIEFIGAGVTIADDPVNGRTQITIASGTGPAEPHEESHLYEGSDELEGDKIRIEYEPANYSRAPVPGLITDPVQLTAHLAGIDGSLLAISNDYVSRIADLARVVYVAVPGTTHTFDIDNAGKTLLCSSASAVALPLPSNTTVPYEVGTVLGFVPMGTGQLTFSAGAGATVSSGGNELKSLRQFGPVYAQKTGTNAWLLSGEKAA